MKIEEAIEILNNLSHGGFIRDARDEYNALKLGIEALKCVKSLRFKWGNNPDLSLLGETKE